MALWSYTCSKFWESYTPPAIRIRIKTLSKGTVSVQYYTLSNAQQAEALVSSVLATLTEAAEGRFELDILTPTFNLVKLFFKQQTEQENPGLKCL
jgi:hypothetical protein